MAQLTRVLSSEWTKIKTVRSTVWTLALTFLLTVVIGVGLCLLIRFLIPAEDRGVFDPTFTSFGGIGMGQLAVICFGVLVVTSEYSSGMIRASLAAVPQRGLFMGAKAIVAVGVALAVGLVTAFVSFFLGQLALGSELNASIGEPGVLRAVVGAGVYLALMAALSMGVAWLLRTPMLSFGVLIPLFFLVSGILSIVPHVQDVAQFLPDQAGAAIMAAGDMGEFGGIDRAYGPWGGLLIMVLWVAAALAAGYATLRSRDA
ncbi:ABC transporter permease [Streptomyces alkaliterrae]|uniref:ABC transporter permease n=1 Tax=Streptomyces alkaliterrae TaxID=2213162 RepID=A0A5P0YQM9_9ACTN|nr:ABC transporter permease [Streptomyces alkaliterrae]MBB1252997.1 ABC transporter permease [Streptomyces alkaliterrae]MBB1257536.1 ABC transporter permease [Streptomyces alkaliterrae]MQS02575.1 ABC transporter permease [Streptomyces alkaliterrae]